jgi:hypothetical protein
MSMVREACCKFLLRQLHPSNCLGIRNFADAHSCKELQTRSHRFALQNFSDVMSTEEFVLLPLEEVRSRGRLTFDCFLDYVHMCLLLFSTSHSKLQAWTLILNSKHNLSIHRAVDECACYWDDNSCV